jgi:hypothetical protein
MMKIPLDVPSYVFDSWDNKPNKVKKYSQPSKKSWTTGKHKSINKSFQYNAGRLMIVI